MKASIVGVGFCGSALAGRLAQTNVFDELVLLDIRDGWAEGIALDIASSSPIEKFNTKVIGITTKRLGVGYEAIQDSDIVIITAGMARKPGMSRLDLLGINAKIVGRIAEYIKHYSPEAIVIVVSNPVDEMTALVHKITGFPHKKIIGQAGILDSSRFAYFISEKIGMPVDSIEATVIGSHGDNMVPVLSRTFADGKPLSEFLSSKEIAKLVARTRNAGAEIVEYLKTGSSFFAASSAIAKLAIAVAVDSREVLSVIAFLDGEYSVHGMYLGVEAIIGREGVEKVIESDLSKSEYSKLMAASAEISEKTVSISF
jgi:malate dehydrogenase